MTGMPGNSTMDLNLPVVDISPFMDWPSTAETTTNGDTTSAPKNKQPHQQQQQQTPPYLLNPSQESTARTLRNALRHPGFFYLIGHSVPPQLVRRVLQLGRDFYETNEPEKMKHPVARDTTSHNCDGARGWQDVGDPEDCTDWHEALDFYREIDPRGVSEHRRFKAEKKDTWAGKDGIFEGRNLWPAGVVGGGGGGGGKEEKEEEEEEEETTMMRRVYEEEYIPKMMEVGTAVMRAMGYALQLDDPETLVKMTGSKSFWCLRVMGYPPIPEQLNKEIGGEGCGEHSDYGCLTLLVADGGGKGSLKIKVEEEGDGEERGEEYGEEEEEEEKTKTKWVDADPVEGAFVVNIGDMVERWTGGWARSTRHKVVHEGKGYRISVPFFFEPAKEVVVRRLPEFGGREGDGTDVRYWDHLVSKTDGSFYRKVTW